MTVATRDGRVRGIRTETLRAWRGIPYARPPVGPLRFRRPLPTERWNGVLDAVEHSPIAWQSGALSDAVFPSSPQPPCNEDCLSINISAPLEPPLERSGYPVLVWIHSGGNVVGWGAGKSVGDGIPFVNRGIMVVSFNYRLGALGFLHLSGVLGADEADAGVVGLLDQIEALRWVHDNIAAFGGDPKRVTIYGVSAGGESVANLLASPASYGLVRRAILSGGGGSHIAQPEQAQVITLRFLRELGLAPGAAAKLRQVPPADLVAAQDAMAPGVHGAWVWRPVVGSSILPVVPIAAIARGDAFGRPLLIG
ncbi:MAG: carboxylesterase family protein, partial [Gaiellaceae bacterium]